MKPRIKYFREWDIATERLVWRMIVPAECGIQFSVLTYDEWRLGINFIQRLV